MRIRMWTAFASNNSGSYTLVGSFGTPAEAVEAADALREALATQDAWLRTHEGRHPDEAPPLHAFIREHGLRLDSEHVGLTDDWPATWAQPPVVERVESQVLVHVGQTVTMPRVLGEFVYKRGGRVDTELVHAHHREVVEFTFWTRVSWQDRDEARILAHFAALRAELCDVVLPALEADRRAHDTRAPVAPAWQDGEYVGHTQLFAVFHDLVAGVRAVRDCAERHDVGVRLRVGEAALPDGDLLAHVRSRAPAPRGRWQVVLWSAGAQREATARALREATGCDLATTREQLASAPVVVLDAVAEPAARGAAQRLRDAGADAQALGPADFVRG